MGGVLILNLHERRLLVANGAYSACALLLVGLSLLLAQLPLGSSYSLAYCLATVAAEFAVLGLPFGLCLSFPCMRSLPAWRRLFARPSALLWLVIPIAFTCYFVVNGLTVAWLGLLGLFGPTALVQTVPIPESPLQLLLGSLVIGLAPALAEELFFRGAMQGAYARLKPWVSILVVGVLFGMLHGQISALPGHVLLGVLLCALVYWTGSIWPSMLLHFLQNTLAVGLSMAAQRMLELYEQLGMGDMLAQQETALLSGGLSTVLTGVSVAIGFGIPLAALLALFYFLAKKRRPAAPPPPAPEEARVSPLCFLPLLPALLVIAFLYLNSTMALYGLLPS